MRELNIDELSAVTGGIITGETSPFGVLLDINGDNSSDGTIMTHQPNMFIGFNESGSTMVYTNESGVVTASPANGMDHAHGSDWDGGIWSGDNFVAAGESGFCGAMAASQDIGAALGALGAIYALGGLVVGGPGAATPGVITAGIGGAFSLVGGLGGAIGGCN